ncbi:diatom spindle kinesin 1 [Amylocarpus encephaloides]|uniref:Diatom spindle kinesin 1 n=1 Tax=Amylocarpus encephaloides TaxID=45428 RepID=A0A9P8C913_9HELO|nr:diatom spindle kinesin 1 [Amylocarpus encephaloides]
MDFFSPQTQKFFLGQVAAFDKAKQKTKQAVEQPAPNSGTAICARIRPLSEEERNNHHVPALYARTESGIADIHELSQKVNGRLAVNSSSFQLDRIYGPQSRSDEIYKDLVAPLVPWAWAGGISTLFAYGQTGSGKTFTIDHLERMAAEHLFGEMDGNREVYAAVFELEGNIASDLLNDRRTISVMEDSFGESQLVGALEPQVKSAEELLDLIDRSMKFRKTAPTLKNDSSSRTHAVCRIRIVNKDVSETADGLLFLVDLAGSEAAADIKHHAQDRMKETKEINKSLSILKDCIRGRSTWYAQQNQDPARAKQVYIPYRNSTLTKVLKHVFDMNGNRHCETAVVSCTPAALKAWIDTSSGDPPINSSILAPTESGIQLCRLPIGEFVSRCLKTPGVSEQHARAFYYKLWGLHIDSGKASSGKPQGDAPETREPEARSLPFHERIRAGMFIQMKCTDPDKEHMSKVMIMAPERAFDRPGSGEPEEGIGGSGNSRRYVCALVLHSPMAGAYEVDVTRQVVIGIDEMEKEFLMEYEPVTRCYYMTI